MSWALFLLAGDIFNNRKSELEDEHDEKLRLITGHLAEEITEHYTHLLEEDYTEIRKVQKDVFGNSERIEGHDKLG